MHKVAHHLQTVAIDRDESDRDIFARSAYNRYYYAVFLAVRDMLSEMDSKWSHLAHKNYPEVLTGESIMKQFQKEKKRAEKNSDYALNEKLDKAIRAVKALSSLMSKAYVVRVVADYEPSEAVNFISGERFSLKSVDITEAHSWNNKAEIWIKDIQQAWRQINA